jgi:hypothetical protein
LLGCKRIGHVSYGPCQEIGGEFSRRRVFIRCCIRAGHSTRGSPFPFDLLVGKGDVMQNCVSFSFRMIYQTHAETIRKRRAGSVASHRLSWDGTASGKSAQRSGALPAQVLREVEERLHRRETMTEFSPFDHHRGQALSPWSHIQRLPEFGKIIAAAHVIFSYERPTHA